MAQAEGSGIVGPGGLGLRGSGWSGVCDGDQSAHEVGTANPGLALPEKKSSVEQGKGVGGTCFLSFPEIKKQILCNCHKGDGTDKHTRNQALSL